MDSHCVVEGVVFEGELLMVWLYSIEDEETNGENDDDGIIEDVSVQSCKSTQLQPPSTEKNSREDDFSG